MQKGPIVFVPPIVARSSHGACACSPPQCLSTGRESRVRAAMLSPARTTGSTCQTELETFTRVTAYGVAGNGPQYFFAEVKEGLYYEYGVTSDSRVFATGSTTPYVWALNKVRDRQGNNFTVRKIAGTAFRAQPGRRTSDSGVSGLLNVPDVDPTRDCSWSRMTRDHKAQAFSLLGPNIRTIRGLDSGVDSMPEAHMARSVRFASFGEMRGLDCPMFLGRTE